MSQESPNTPSEFVHFVQDAKRCISSFGSIVERAPLQTYGTLLFFSPAASQVRQRLWDERMPRLGDIQGIQSNLDGRLQTLESHGDNFSAIAFSPDSQLLASASNNGKVRLWNPSTGTELRALVGQSDFIYNLSIDEVIFSPNSCLLASVSHGETIKIWNTTTGAHQHTLRDYPDPYEAIAFSPDSNFIISVTASGEIRLWDVRTGTCQETIGNLFDGVSDGLSDSLSDGHDSIHDSDNSAYTYTNSLKISWTPTRKFVFSPCTQLLATTDGNGDKAGAIHLWALSTRSHYRSLRGRFNPVTAIAFSPDSKFLASGTLRGELWLWDVATGAIRFKLENGRDSPNRIHTVAFSTDAKLLVSASRETVLLWNLTTGAYQNILTGYSERINVLAFSPDSQLLALMSGYHESIQLWDATLSPNQEEIFDGHDNYITAIAFSPDIQLVASASMDHTVQLWDAPTGIRQKILRGHTDRVADISFSPDNKFLASSSEKEMRIWDVENGALKDTVTGYWGRVTKVVYSPDGQRVVSVTGGYRVDDEDQSISLWNAETGTLQQTFDSANVFRIVQIAFSPDSQTIALLSSHGSLCLWDASTGEDQQTFQDRPGNLLTQMLFSPDNQLIATVDRDEVWVWNRRSCSRFCTLRHEGIMGSVVFSPNSQLIASAARDEVLWLWNAVTGVLHRKLRDQKGFSRAISFSSDSQMIAVASSDTSVRVWNIAMDPHPCAVLDHSSVVTRLEFSPDKQMLATASRDKIIRIWNVASGIQQQMMLHDRGNVMGITFSADELVVSISSFESPRFWNLWESMTLEIRRYRITGTSQEPSPDLDSCGAGLSDDKTWITNGSEEVVWLSPEYRPASRNAWDARGSTIFLGCRSGRVIRFQAT